MDKGSIVKYAQGFYRITRLTKNTVNLGPVFGGRVIHKSIPRSDVIEAREEFHQYWRQTESYRSM